MSDILGCGHPDKNRACGDCLEAAEKELEAALHEIAKRDALLVRWRFIHARYMNDQAGMQLEDDTRKLLGDLKQSEMRGATQPGALDPAAMVFHPSQCPEFIICPACSRRSHSGAWWGDAVGAYQCPSCQRVATLDDILVVTKQGKDDL